MIFDSIRHVYVENGRGVPASEIRQHVEDYITQEKSEVDRKAKLLLAGAITIAAFFEFLQEKIATWHAITGQVGYGGAAQMNPERWLRINEKIQSELTYLDAFQTATEQGYARSLQVAAEIAKQIEANNAVPAGLETVVEEHALEAIMASDASERGAAVMTAIKNALADSIGSEAESVSRETLKAVADSPWDEMLWGSLESRGRMYADAAYSTYANSEKASAGDAGLLKGKRICAEDDASCDECVGAATDDYIPLDEILDIGDATCMCVTTPHSRVLTSNGWLPIGHVTTGDWVWTHRARWRPVTRRIVRRSQSGQKFVSLNGVGFTDSHRLLTPEGWQPISVIVRDELLVYNWPHEGLDQSEWADPARPRHSSQEPQPHARPPLELTTQNEEQPRHSSRQRSNSRVAESNLSDLQDSIPRAQAWPLETPQILQRGMRETPILLWDLEVSGDHSFVIEGVVSHNSNCRCVIEYEYAGIDELAIDRELYA